MIVEIVEMMASLIQFSSVYGKVGYILLSSIGLMDFRGGSW